LAAADNPASVSDVRPEHLESIVRIAKNYYDFIIIDLGRQIDALTVKAMDLSDDVYPVVQLILPYIRDAKHLLDMFKSLGYSQNKVKFIVNRYEKNNKLKLEDLHNALNISHSFTIPNEYDVVTESVNQGVPVVRLAPNGAVSKALKEVCEKVTDTQLNEKGFFTKIFR
jgi:pilus assembly protein CpaE